MANPKIRSAWIASLVVMAIAAGYYTLVSSGKTSTATLVTETGRHSLSLELADTPEEREIGLMNRQSMPDGHGMLFDFKESRPVTMWMKNTLIPLDMLFMDASGTITRVATNAQPMSLDLIRSGGPVSYVLELNAGTAARYKAKKGDRLIDAAAGLGAQR